MASAPKVPKMSQVEPTRVTITYPADEEHWDRDLSRTWSVKLYFVTFLASFQSSTGLYYVVRIPRIILQPGYAGISVQQRSTGFFNICKFSKFSPCGCVALSILCGSDRDSVRLRKSNNV